MEEEFTSIGIKPKTKERLEKLKVHPNQSFDELINKILDDIIRIKK